MSTSLNAKSFRHVLSLTFNVSLGPLQAGHMQPQCPRALCLHWRSSLIPQLSVIFSIFLDALNRFDWDNLQFRTQPVFWTQVESC